MTKEPKDIYEILRSLQRTLKAPKGQTNSFGGYKYRSCEDILEALKPIMPEGAAVTISDDIVMLGQQSLHRETQGDIVDENGVSQGQQRSILTIGERFYVKATATLHFNGQTVSVNAFAREPLERKGSDASQITGASSSYARKYALNGLFLIDDSKDADSGENKGGIDNETIQENAPATYGAPGNQRTTNPAVNKWFEAGIGDMNKAKDLKELEKVYKLFYKHAKQSGCTDDQLMMIGQQKDAKKEALLLAEANQEADQAFERQVGEEG